MQALAVIRRIELPPVWLVAFIALVWAVGRGMPVPVPFGGAVGGVIVLAGLGLMALAAFAMMRARTTIIPRSAPSALVTSGIFRLTRNPIYLGDAMVLAGLCLRWDAPQALILVPVFAWVIARRFIDGEEARLREAFGAEFDSWAARVGRWF
jgi:protein-S-isoprenylcysteine O-methyltransferase Ste14